MTRKASKVSKRADWVRMRKDLAFICERCGDVQPMGESPGFDFYTGASRVYLRIHRRCRPKADTNE